jgi:hypothetical protein
MTGTRKTSTHHDDDHDHNHDDDDQWREQAMMNEEFARFRRFLRCMGIMLVIWFGMLYLIVHHDNGLVIAGLVMMLLWIIYMCACICWNLKHSWHQRQKVATSPNNNDDEHDEHEDEETGGLTVRGKGSSLVSSSQGVFPFAFHETPQKLKQCSTLVTPGIGPTNGTYTAVLSAIYFNKPIRSEGTLRLEFLATHDNGWTIQGESRFGKHTKTRVIKEGFVNAEGKMYWKVGDSIHRGVLDFGSSCLFDGDFVPNLNQWIPTQVGPVGRIVRLELAKASFYSSNVEMVTFSRNDDDDDENGDEQEDLFR